MNKFMFSIPDIIVFIAIPIASLLIGIFVSGFVVARLKKATARFAWLNEDSFFHLLKWAIILAAFVAGFYWALDDFYGHTALFRKIRKIYVSSVIIAVTIICARISIVLAELYGKKLGSTFFSSSIFSYVIRVVIVAVGILTCLSYWGINIAPLLAALGVGGFAVALALQDTLSNLFAGINILASNKIKIGDFVKVDGGAEGIIEDISWRCISLRSPSNNVTVIPNAKIASAIVTNYHLEGKETSIPVMLGVAYGSDLEKVEKITLEVAKESMLASNGGVDDFEPKLNYSAFGDSSINFSVTLRAKAYEERAALMHDFIKRVHKRYQKEGIEIPFPIRTVIVKK